MITIHLQLITVMLLGAAYDRLRGHYPDTDIEAMGFVLIWVAMFSSAVSLLVLLQWLRRKETLRQQLRGLKQRITLEQRSLLGQLIYDNDDLSQVLISKRDIFILKYLGVY